MQKNTDSNLFNSLNKLEKFGFLSPGDNLNIYFTYKN
jgi:hypothetical protein